MTGARAWGIRGVSPFAGDAQALIDWFNDGADGQIDWGSPGDFEQCVKIAAEHLDNPEGFCNERHQDAVGGPPGSEDKSAIRASGSQMGQTDPMGNRLMTRNDVLHQFAADGGGALTAAAALSVQYAQVTQAARVRLGAEPYWAGMDEAERMRAAAAGSAMPDGTYPIFSATGTNSVDAAIHALGNAGPDHDDVRAFITRRAASLGCADKTAAWAELVTTAAAPPPPAPATPADAKPDAGEGSPEDATVDAGMDVLVKNLVDDIDKLVAQQAKDPGNDSGLDAQIVAKLDQLKAIGADLAKTQAADSAEGPKPEAPKPDGDPSTPDKPPSTDAGVAPPDDSNSGLAAESVTAAGATPGGNTTPGNAEGVPNDADDNGPGPGAIEASLICQNPDCNHLASVHANDVTNGDNSGTCTTPGCTCPGMVPPGDQVNSPSDSGDGTNDGQSNDNSTDSNGSDAVGAPGTASGPVGGGRTGKGTAIDGAESFAPGDTPPPPAPAPTNTPDEVHQAPPVGGAPAAQLPPLNPLPSDTVGPMFTCPVAWLEEEPTGDGRMIDAPGPDNAGLTWRTPPLALMGMKTSSHDPSGMSPNAPAVLIGRIETIERRGAVGWAQGHLLATDDGMDFADILQQMGRMGVSIDVGSAQVQITADPTMEPTGDVFDLPVMEHLTEGEVLGITVCPFAAFAGAYIVLGDGSDVPEADVPAPPDGAAMSINFVDAEPCVPCAPEDASEALVSAASPEAPSLIHPPTAWFANPGFGRDEQGNRIDPRLDPRLSETIDPKTGKPSGKFACPPTVTPDGQVFMHVAQWGVCHQSPQFLNNGQCILAPRSRTDYAAFHGTGSVLTAEGELIGVGRMTADTGHAPTTPGFSYAQAVAHYDNSGLTAALVRAGEDEFGVWVAGSLHPSASEEQVFTMRANPPSGDWRPFGAGRELCNVLFVNNPGFPMVRATQDVSSGQFTSLIAAGVPLFAMPDTNATPLSIEDRLARIEAANAPVYELAREHLRSKRAAII